MQIGGILKFSLIDYPGKMAAVIFTQGCNFRCSYCHNPELVVPERFEEPFPEGLIMDFLKKRQGQLEGIVITGGEPTLQPDLIPTLRTLKSLGYSIKIDTNGTRPDVLSAIIDAELCDFIAMDIKGAFHRYRDIAGVEVNTHAIADSIDIIISSGIEHQFRTTLVKALVSEDDVGKIFGQIQGSGHYSLQQFIPSEKILNKEILQNADYTDKEVQDLRESFCVRHRNDILNMKSTRKDFTRPSINV